MEETKTTQADVRPLRPLDDAGLGAAFSSGVAAIERAVQTSFDLVEVARREVMHAAFAAAELLESSQQSTTKVVRETLAKVDKASEQLAASAQATALAVATNLRDSGERAVDLLARTAEPFGVKRSRPSAA